MRPDVSVIIPAYRRPVELEAALRSVLSQANVTTEIVVVDDCPDGSASAVVAGFHADGIRYLKNPEPSRGRPAVVRNLGWPLARGELVHFLDDDDLVPEGHYEAARAAFAAHRDVGVVFGRVEPFGAVDLTHERQYFADATRRARRFARFGRRLGLGAAMVFGPTPLVCGAAMIRRSCIADLGGFDPDLELVEDVDFYARAIRRFGALVLDRVSLHYRIGPSLMHRPGQQDAIAACYRRIQARYRAEHGALEFVLAKAFVRVMGG